MALNIKNAEVERLAEEVADLEGTTKTEAIRRALLRARADLSLAAPLQDRAERLRRFLADEVWPRVPPEELGRRLTREEEEEILGFGEHGA
jgi:antitoxin VapB